MAPPIDAGGRIGLGFELPGAAEIGQLEQLVQFKEKSVKCFRICWTRGDSTPGLLVVSEAVLQFVREIN